MNNILLLKIGFTLLIIMFSTAADAAAQKTTIKSHCRTDELTIWSCAAGTRGKIASVCASKVLTEDTGYLQYRFGLLGNIELEYPKDLENSQKAFKYSRYTRPLVTMLTLSFINNGVAYKLHTDDNAEEKPPVRSSYIEIETGGKTSTVQCRLPVTGSLMDLEDVVPRNEEN